MNWIIAVPELVLAVSALALLMLGVFLKGEQLRAISWLAILALAVTMALVIVPPSASTGHAFGNLFIVDRFAQFMKVLALGGTALSILLSLDYAEREHMARFEFPVLMLFATLGMLLMISANDLIALYLGLELQSLALYVVAAFQRDSLRSTEAGLKYFVLGALSSGMLLYGASMIYGFAGTTGFAGLAAALTDSAAAPIGLIIGLVFVLAGLAFKVSAVPFHMWTPDVYEGSPTPVTAFFSAAPKIAAIALLTRVVVGPFGHLAADWQQVIVFISIASMVLGGVAGMVQRNIKRLMAYSSIGNVGYALVGLAAGTPEGVRGLIIYMSIYVAMTLGSFACILAMRRKGVMVEQISDLAGVSRSNPLLAASLALFMFSMAGIPPLAGFFGKLYVFLPAISAGLYTLAVIGVLASVIAAYYYLRIIKVMYFDELKEGFQPSKGWEIPWIMAVSALAILLFFVLPGPLFSAAQAAAASLFGG
jgi:NADH-quinone oxidoreductase subunit N